MGICLILAPLLYLSVYSSLSKMGCQEIDEERKEEKIVYCTSRTISLASRELTLLYLATLDTLGGKLVLVALGAVDVVLLRDEGLGS